MVESGGSQVLLLLVRGVTQAWVHTRISSFRKHHHFHSPWVDHNDTHAFAVRVKRQDTQDLEKIVPINVKNGIMLNTFKNGRYNVDRFLGTGFSFSFLKSKYIIILG